MEAHRISSQLLRHRLNADYYTREALDNDDVLRHYGCVTLGSKFDHVNSGYGILPGSEEYLPAGSGVGLVRGGDLQLGAIKPPEVNAPISYQTDWTMLRKGDVLLLIKGACIDSPEGVGLVGDAEVGKIFNGSCYRIRLSGYDSGFLVAFCLTRFFLIQKRREIANTGISYNDEKSINNYLVPNSAPRVQSYIGDKVRQAKRLREAELLYIDECKSFIHSKCTFEVPATFRESPRRVTPQRVSEHSLGPYFTWAMEGQRTLNDSAPFKELIISCLCGEPIRADERVSGLYLYYGASGPIDLHDEYNYDGEYLIVAQDGSIGLACVARDKFWANNHVWVLALKPEYDPDLIALYLTEHYPFWKGIKTGSVVPKVTSENLMKVVVPNEVATARKSYGAKLRLAVELKAMANSLTDAGRFLVEALIENKLTEAELVAAQEGLEHGDNSADRALLSRLTRQGIDVPGQPPLFPDLDALYALLAQTQEEPI